MKRIFFLLIAISFYNNLPAQTIADALRYSTDNTQGTARFAALSGAFGALGGDLSSLGFNPAGSSVFLQNQTGVTLSINQTNNKSNYFNTASEANHTDFDISNAGGVFVFNNYNENSSWKKLAVAINYNNQAIFDQEIFVTGKTANSIGNYFLGKAQGTPLDLLQLQAGESISDLYAYLGETQGTNTQNAFLGYQGYLFDPVEENPNNTLYTSNLGTGTYNQEFYNLTNGYKGKYTLNLSAQYTNHLFFGLNLNAHSINFRQGTFFYETNTNSNSTVKKVEFENHLETIGDGFSFQIGGIVKVNSQFRVGLAFDSPTWFTISEETLQYLSSMRIENGESYNAIVDPSVINVFNEYQLQTPSKIAASAAYIFGKNGLLSVEYSYQDFSKIKFKPTSDPFFISENNSIANKLSTVSTFRVGAEYRIHQLSFRGGFIFEESPYKDLSIVANKTGGSIGIGYNAGSYNFDVAYSRNLQKKKEPIYLQENSAEIDNVSSSYLFSLNINL